MSSGQDAAAYWQARFAGGGWSGAQQPAQAFDFGTEGQEEFHEHARDTARTTSAAPARLRRSHARASESPGSRHHRAFRVVVSVS